MWDTEPAPAGPLAALRRWLLPLVGLAAAGALLLNRERPAAAPQAGAAAVQQQRGAAAAPAKAAAAAQEAPRPAVLAKAVAAFTAAPEAAVVARGAPLTAAAAAREVRRLQAAKAEAMGPEHRASALGRVMRGRLLRQWRAQAERARAAGSHYVYQFRGARVERVAPWTPAGWMRAGAEVVFTESDSVSVRPDNGAGARSGSVDRTLRRTMRMQKARFVPGAEWKVVDIVDAV